MTQKKYMDFLITKKGRPTEAIQVTYDDSDNEKTWEREIGSMLECLERVGLNQGLILTQKREEQMKVKGKQIFMKPLYKWLLE